MAAPGAEPAVDIARWEGVRAWWTTVNLPTKQEEWSAVSGELVTKQEEGVASRKALTDAYKAFRKLPEEEKGAAVGPLLKAFQEEVDALTRRSRLAEKSFLQFMAAMLEAPNPAPFLLAGLDASRSAARLADELARSQAETRAASATAAAALEEAATERERLRADVADLERELAKLSNQDITLREMETRLVDFEGTMEAQIAARLGEREAELRKVFEGELEAVREAETAAEARVAALQGALSEAVSMRDEAQAALYTSRARGDDDASARASEVDVLAGETERLLGEVAALRAQLDRERQAAAASAAGGGSGDDDPLPALRAQVASHRRAAEAAEVEAARLRGSVAGLQDECRRWAAMLDAQREAAERAAAEAEARTEVLRGEAAAASEELAKRPTWADVQSLRHQLAVVHAVAFNASSDEFEGAVAGQSPPPSSIATSLRPLPPADSAEPDAPAAGDTDVHSLLLRRIRQLESRLVRADAARSEAEAACADLRARMEAAQDTITDQAALVKRLDDALSARLGPASALGATATAGAAPAGGGAAGGERSDGGAALGSQTPLRSAAASSQAPHSPLLSPQLQLESVLGGAAAAPRGLALPDPAATSPSHSAAASDPSQLGGSDARLRILQDQRDRFRARVLELEADCQAKDGTAQEAVARVTRLTADNVKLYEKIRYLQSLVASRDGAAADASEQAAAASAAAAAAAVGGPAGSGVRVRGAGASAPFAATVDEDFEKPYSRMYADSLDPFADFSRREKARRYASLSAAEKITLTSSRIVLASKFARTAVLIYVVVMHLLVVATLWHFGHVSHKGCGDHSGHVFDGATLGGPAAAAEPPPTARERLLERLKPTSLRGTPLLGIAGRRGAHAAALPADHPHDAGLLPAAAASTAAAGGEPVLAAFPPSNPREPAVGPAEPTEAAAAGEAAGGGLPEGEPAAASATVPLPEPAAAVEAEEPPASASTAAPVSQAAAAPGSGERSAPRDTGSEPERREGDGAGRASEPGAGDATTAPI